MLRLCAKLGLLVILYNLNEINHIKFYYFTAPSEMVILIENRAKQSAVILVA